MNFFEFTLIHGGTRHVRNIIAFSSLQATRIGIALMPATDAPLAIICKPIYKETT